MQKNFLPTNIKKIYLATTKNFQLVRQTKLGNLWQDTLNMSKNFNITVILG